jgi:hypothetical protein
VLELSLGRSRSESSPMVPVNGKHLNPSNIHVDDVLTKVFDKMAHDKNIARQMVLSEGVKEDGMSGRNVLKSDCYCLIGVNDGSFINNPIEPVLTMPVDSNNVVGLNVTSQILKVGFYLEVLLNAWVTG